MKANIYTHWLCLVNTYRGTTPLLSVVTEQHRGNIKKERKDRINLHNSRRTTYNIFKMIRRDVRNKNPQSNLAGCEQVPENSVCIFPTVNNFQCTTSVTQSTTVLRCTLSTACSCNSIFPNPDVQEACYNINKHTWDLSPCLGKENTHIWGCPGRSVGKAHTIKAEYLSHLQIVESYKKLGRTCDKTLKIELNSG